MKLLLLSQAVVLLASLLPAVVSAGKPGGGGCDNVIGNGGNAVTVDGSFDDWSDADFLSNMHEAGKETKRVGAYAYAKYDCSNNLLCVHVKAAPGEVLVGEYWVKSGKVSSAMKPTSDGLQTAEDGSGNVIGWEACYKMDNTGDVDNVEIHSNFDNGDTASTGKSGICLSWDCAGAPEDPVPAPVEAPVPAPVPAPVEAPTGCGSDDECMPENPDMCQVYKCNAGTCESAPAVDETPCGNSQGDGLCYLGDHCMAGACVPKYESIEHVCRPANGGCDIAETCSPDGTCPEDSHMGDMTLCGSSHDDMPCQKHDVCIAGVCEAQYEDTTVTCGNADSDECMIPATCTGKSGSCPADEPVPNGETCGPEQPDLCRAQNQCNNGKCEAVYMPKEYVCRAAEGPCDVDDHCKYTVTQYCALMEATPIILTTFDVSSTFQVQDTVKAV